MERIDTSEQWSLDGNCEKCRRAKYCHKSCGAKKRKMKASLTALEEVIMARLTRGILSL